MCDDPHKDDTLCLSEDQHFQWAPSVSTFSEHFQWALPVIFLFWMIAEIPWMDGSGVITVCKLFRKRRIPTRSSQNCWSSGRVNWSTSGCQACPSLACKRGWCDNGAFASWGGWRWENTVDLCNLVFIVKGCDCCTLNESREDACISSFKSTMRIPWEARWGCFIADHGFISKWRCHGCHLVVSSSYNCEVCQEYLCMFKCEKLKVKGSTTSTTLLEPTVLYRYVDII